MTNPLYLKHYRASNFRDCEIECLEVIASNPREFNPHLVLCVSLTRLNKNEEAVEKGLIALEIVDATADLRARQLDRLSDAIGYYRKAISLVPSRPEGLFALAEALYANNEFDESREVFELFFGLGDVPNDLLPHALYTYSIMNSELDLQEFIARFPRLPRRVNHHLFFHGIGNLLIAQNETESALKSYDLANSLRRSTEPYSFETELEIFDLHLRYIAEESLPISYDFPKSGRTPIFIVGMPRTGSSLLEQMLGAHSSISPTGETGWLMQILRETLSVSSDSAAFFGGLRNLDNKDFVSQLRANYFEKVSILKSEYFIDKTLGNFQLLWLIKSAFPEATVLHSAREKGPTIWSCYKTSFKKGVRFSESLPEAATYFDKVEELMSRWSQKPGSSPMRIQYEELIENPERMVRRVLARLNLDFELDTLNPSRQIRIVNTASKVQVTKPIYKIPNKEFEPFRRLVETRISQNT